MTIIESIVYLCFKPSTANMIRPANKSDQAQIARILHTIDLFPPEILANEMSDYLINPDTEHFWFVHEDKAIVNGFCYCVPEQLTDRTYNLLAIEACILPSRVMALVEN